MNSAALMELFLVTLIYVGRSLAINQSGAINILEGLYKMRIGESDQLETEVAMDEQEIEQQNAQPSYQKLRTTVKRCLDQRKRAQNFEARK